MVLLARLGRLTPFAVAFETPEQLALHLVHANLLLQDGQRNITFLYVSAETVQLVFDTLLLCLHSSAGGDDFF